MKARILLLLLVFAAPLGAQTTPGHTPDDQPKNVPFRTLLFRPFHDRQITLLAGFHAGTTVWDDTTTRIVLKQGGRELNPLMKPFAHNTAAITADAAVEVWGSAILADWMKRSHYPLVRKVWWIPQVMNISSGFAGGLHNTIALTR